MSSFSLSQAIGSVARMCRFRRVMLVEIDAGEHGVSTAATSNLSRGGLAAIGDASVQPGDHVWLRFGNLPRRAATVVWRNGRRMGFAFDREIDLLDYFGMHFQAPDQAAATSRS